MIKPIALIAEDTDANRIFFERLLAQAGFDVRSAVNGQECLDVLKNTDQLALALVDMELPGTNGLELTHRIREQFADACIIVATMHDKRSLMQSAFDRGCDVFMVKPHGFMELFKQLTTKGSSGIHEAGPLVIDQFGLRDWVPASQVS